VEIITVRVLPEDSENAPFDDWYKSLTDKKTRQAIASRLLRVRQGNFGDHHSVGGGVSELRIHLGSGYRIYYSRQGSSLVILLGGGTKRRQNQDIEEAISLWERYRDEIEKYSRDI
jgi:putative addiction module killer protein